MTSPGSTILDDSGGTYVYRPTGVVRVAPQPTAQTSIQWLVLDGTVVPIGGWYA